MSRTSGRPVTCICPQCGAEFTVGTGEFNRAQKTMSPLYCGRKCAGLSRRLKNPPTDTERKAAKAEYDREYREKNRERLRAIKAERFQRWYADPENKEKARAERAAKMEQHVEYCRRPEYRAWKKVYDRAYLAKKRYGEYAEVALTLRDLQREVRDQAAEEVYLEKAREKSNERGHPRSEGADGE